MDLIKYKARTEKTPFHLVDPSPWPIVTSTGSFVLVTGTVMFMHGYGWVMMSIGLVYLIMGMWVWFRDIIREGTYEGQHTSIVQVSLRFGMMLFICSEVMFFVSFFWAFYWVSLAAVPEIGSVWPPRGIVPMAAWEVPFLNTLILLSSGASVTWAHHGLVVGSRRDAVIGLVLTVMLGAVFTGLQGYEYVTAGFNISDSVYGTTFFMATGFHGFHVIIGTIMLCVSLVRVYSHEMTKQHHFGFEASAWYWHFVDVVWLFLFVSIYCWGG